MQIALVGNPNTGKSSIFNALTGLRQKVSNYPGVTVEKKTGIFKTPLQKIEIIDLPGLYSLVPKSLDDKIASDVLAGNDSAVKLRAIVVVINAANIHRNFYLFSQILDFDLPVIVALNMMDSATRKGIKIDVQKLQKELDIPIIPIIAHKKKGIPELKTAIIEVVNTYSSVPKKMVLKKNISNTLAPLTEKFENYIHKEAIALRLISNDTSHPFYLDRQNDIQKKEVLQTVKDIRKKLLDSGTHWSMLEAKLRYEWIDSILNKCVQIGESEYKSFSVKLDKVLTHRVAGPLIFLAIFALIFQTIFSWADAPMQAIETAINWVGIQLGQVLPAGVLHSLIVDGIIAGVGSILVFLPQILFLFFFLSLLEDTGYLARAAFMLDRVMRFMGLTGRSVIPLLSSFACAIPGIMATRTINNWRDRLVTILIAPFMSCSARLPVYVLMIGAFIPEGTFLGIISYSAITLLAMYTIGILAAVLVAFIFKNHLIECTTADTSFVMELPSYHKPSLRWTALQMYERAKIFVEDAGKIILAMSIVLWFLASYPKVDTEADISASSKIEQSYAGQIGKFMEPAIKPLGFDWKIGIGLLTSFAAREVMVSTMATIYNVENGDETSVSLKTALRNDRNKKTGELIYSPLTAISLMVFFVLACQCMATVAVVKRETNSWKWPIFMIAYMTGFAYIGSLLVFQGGKLLGF